jgi:transposase
MQADSLKKKIAQRYEKGESLAQIAKDYGVSAETIRHVLLRYHPEIIRNWEKRKKDPNAYTTVLTLNEEKKIVEYYKRGMGLNKIAKLFRISYNVARKVVHYYAKHLVRAPVGPLRKNIKRQRNWLTRQKASLIGHLIGDGSVFIDKKGRCIIYFSNTCFKLVKFVSRALESVYGIKLKIRKAENRIFYIKCVSKKAWQDLSKYTPYGSREWRVPIEIFQNSTVLGPPFLRSLADDEGSVILHPRRKNDWNRQICLASTSDQGRKDIIHLLSMLGINSYETGILVCITGRENLIRFQRVVGFTRYVKVSRGWWRGLGKLEVLRILNKSYDDSSFPRKFMMS